VLSRPSIDEPSSSVELAALALLALALASGSLVGLVRRLELA
jgi:hypothetical protein